jgi:hypothetical protein
MALSAADSGLAAELPSSPLILGIVTGYDIVTAKQRGYRI